MPFWRKFGNYNRPTPRRTPDQPKRDQEPDPLESCAHCGRRCRVPVTMGMPEKVRAAYEEAGWQFMATCEKGAAVEDRLLGASYEDVIQERLGRVGPATEVERILTVAQGLREASR